MKRVLKPSERLIVAFDKKPSGSEGAAGLRNDFLRFLDDIAETGAIIKGNSILRLLGYVTIHEVKARGLKFFADVKLKDIPETLVNDALWLSAECKPDLVTIMCDNGVIGLRRFREALSPEIEALGVTVLTSMTDEDCLRIHGAGIDYTVMKFAGFAREAKINGLVSSPREVSALRKEFPESTLNTPNIRPKWAEVKGDDQNKARSMTVEEAFAAGADRYVVGRPITQAQNPRDAVLRTIEEIDQAMRAA